MYDSLLINGTKESWYDGIWLVSNIKNLSITAQQLWLESFMQENTEKKYREHFETCIIRCRLMAPMTLNYDR